MKLFLIAAIVLLPLSTPLGAYQAQVAGSTNEQRDKVPERKTEESHKPQSAAPSAVIQQTINSPSSGQEGQRQVPQSAKPSHDWIDKANAWSTIVIAVFTVLLFFAVIVQVRTSRDTERAWVIIAPIQRSPKVGYTLDPQDPRPEDFGQDQSNVFLASFKNTGNTPARLIDSALIYRQANRLEDIPKEPDYGLRGPFQGTILVKEDSVGAFAFLQPNPLVTKSEAIELRQRRIFWYAYGIVAYKDAFNRRHETRFGYLYRFPLGGDPRPAEFTTDGLPTAYNKAT